MRRQRERTGERFSSSLVLCISLSFSRRLRAPGGSLLYSRGNKSSFARGAHARTARPPKLPGVNVAEPRCSKFAALRSVSSFTPEIAGVRTIPDSKMSTAEPREKRAFCSASDSESLSRHLSDRPRRLLAATDAPAARNSDPPSLPLTPTSTWDAACAPSNGLQDGHFFGSSSKVVMQLNKITVLF